MSNVSGDNTIDLTPVSGMDLRGLAKKAGPPFLQNVVCRNGEIAARQGFGTVRMYSTTLNGGRVDKASDYYGLGECIGATAIRTGWGTDQILAVHPVLAFSGDLKDDSTGTDVAGRLGSYFAGVSLVVHDIHTGRHCEFVLHEQDAADDELYNVFPHYALRGEDVASTAKPLEHSRWVVPSSEPTWAMFAQTVGNVVVAIDGVGLCTYRPVEFMGPIDRKARSIGQYLLPYGPGENGVFAPMNLCDGVFALDGLNYFRQVELGSVSAVCSWLDRMVYATSNALLFSDPGRPDNILADNLYILPTQDAITCVAPVRDVLFVATRTACWVCQPVFGATAFSVSATSISSGVGCVSPRSHVAADEGVFFVAEAGVYAFAGGTNLVNVSEPIDRLWTDPQSLQMVLTDYYTATGHTGLDDEQLPARIDVPEQMAKARLTWDQSKETLYCVGDDVTLVWAKMFGWGVWTFQTHAGDTVEVRGVQNVVCPQFVALGGDLYAIGGPDLQTHTHYAYTMDTGADFEPSINDRSCYLLLLGRGGALDRSADAVLEDERECVGGWTQYTGDDDQCAFFIGKPIKAPPLFQGPDSLTSTETFWFPIYVHREDIVATLFRLYFEFDNDKWEPVIQATTPANCVMDALLPNERIACARGFGLVPAPGPGPDATHQIRVYGAGVPDVTGNVVRMDFDGTGGAWSFNPSGILPAMNAQPIGPTLVCLLPFKRKALSFPPLSLVVDVLDASFIPGVSVARTYVWYSEAGGFSGDLSEKTQCVDWAVKTAEFSAKGMQIKVRGVFLEAMHLGNQTGTDALKPTWMYGPLNTATSTDMRDYSGQAIDFTAVGGNSEQRNILPVARLMPTGSSSLVTKVGAGSARWGDVGDPTDGNLLIDDAAVDTLGTSDGSQGVRGSVLVHGTLDAPGEGVRLGKVEAVVRVTGERRRWH